MPEFLLENTLTTLLRYNLINNYGEIILRDIGVERRSLDDQRIRAQDLAPLAAALGVPGIRPQVELGWSKLAVRDTRNEFVGWLSPAEWESLEGCKKCGHRGEFIRLALCCPVHGFIAGC